MKRFIVFIAVLFCASSCYKVEIIKPHLEPAFFVDECWVCDSIAFNMTCSVFPDSAKIQFVKRRIRRNLRPWDKHSEKRDTVIVLEEYYKYTPLAFKEMLIEKGEERGTGEYFNFSQNMCITQETFGKMYNTYIK